MYNDNLAYLGLILLLWLLSPIALIVACVRLSRARARLEEEVERLRAELRSRDGIVPPMPSVEAVMPDAVARGPEAEPDSPRDGAGAESPAGASAPTGDVPPSEGSPLGRAEGVSGQTEARVAKGKTSRGKGMNPLTVVFIVGVLFIVTAGIIFASSAWQELGTAPRIASLGSVVALFFAASGLARKRFDLRLTGLAFFALGSVFLPVSFIASGLLGLFGESFMASGDRSFLLFAGGAFLLGSTAFRGSLLYRSRTFAWVSLSSATCLVAFLAASLNRGIPTTALALSFYSALPVGAIEAYDRLGGSRSRLKTLDRLTGLFRASPFAVPFRPYAALNVLAATVVSFAARGGEYAYGATFAILAVLFLSRVFNDGNRRHSGIGVFPFALCLALWITGLPGAEPVPAVVLSSALVMTLGLSGVVPERTRKASAIASLLAIAWGAISAVPYRAEWSGQLVGALAALSIVAGFRARSGDRAFRAIHPALLAVLAFGCADFIGHSSPAAYAIAGVALLAALIAFGPLGLASRASDAVFLLSLLIDFLVLRDRGSVAGQLTLLMANLAAILFVARKEPLARYAVPHYALLGYLATAGFFARDRYAALAWYAFVVALGSGERFIRARIRVPEAARSFAIATSFWGAVGVFAGFAGSDLSAYHAMPWIALAYMLASRVTSNERSEADLWIAGALFVASPFVSALAFAEARSLTPQWALFAPALASLVLLAPESVPRLVRDHASRKVLFALSVGAIQLISVAASVAYLEGPYLPLTYGAAALALTAAGYAVAHAKGASALAVLPLVLLYAYARRASPGLLPLIAPFSSVGTPELLENLLYCAFFSACVPLSMVLYRSLFERRHDGRVNVDAFALVAPIGPVALVASGMDGLVAQGEYWVFAGLALLAVSALLFWQRTDSEWVDRAALSVSIASLTAAIVAEPFFAIPEVVKDEWTLLLPLAALVAARRFVWRAHGKPLGWVAFAWGCACIAILSWQAMDRGEGVDAVILGAGSLAVFVSSFTLRLKRIFVLSAITLIGLGIYLSREFWLNLAWWIYLLSAGVALISFAVANETMRKRGGGIASKAAGVFAEWRW